MCLYTKMFHLWTSWRLSVDLGVQTPGSRPAWWQQWGWSWTTWGPVPWRTASELQFNVCFWLLWRLRCLFKNSHTKKDFEFLVKPLFWHWILFAMGAYYIFFYSQVLGKTLSPRWTGKLMMILHILCYCLLFLTCATRRCGAEFHAKF